MSRLSEHSLLPAMSPSKAPCAAVSRPSGVTISEQGKLVGDLQAKDATIRGRIEGNVRADKVTLFASCDVKGDIVHGRLAIEDGARFEGNCRPSQSPGS